MLKDSSAQFQARMWLSEEAIEDVGVWVWELSTTQCSVTDWVREHIYGLYSRETIAELLDSDTTKITEGCWQVLIAGTINSYYDSFTGEWDEDINIEKIEALKLKDNYFSTDLT